jgi:hypothetical protein
MWLHWPNQFCWECYSSTNLCLFSLPHLLRTDTSQSMLSPEQSYLMMVLHQVIKAWSFMEQLCSVVCNPELHVALDKVLSVLCSRYCSSSLFFFLSCSLRVGVWWGELGFELRALPLQSRYSTSWATPVLSILEIGSSQTICLGWPWTTVFQVSVFQVTIVQALTTSTWSFVLNPASHPSFHVFPL